MAVLDNEVCKLSYHVDFFINEQLSHMNRNRDKHQGVSGKIVSFCQIKNLVSPRDSLNSLKPNFLYIK